MFDRLGRAWRVVATAFCFAIFGIGGLVLGVLVFPLLSLMLWARARAQRACRRVIHSTLWGFLWLMRTLGVLDYEIRNADRLRRPGLLIVANHPSLIDAVFLLALTPNANCVVKGALARNPFTRGAVQATGWVRNDSGGVAMVDDCIASLRAGSSLIIFPEGTRTRPGAPLQLQRGAANVAVRGDIALTPVVIRCVPPTLTKGEKWYHVPRRRPRFVIDVHADVSVAQWVPQGLEPVKAVRRLNHSLSDYFSREIRREVA
ncbi:MULTISPECIES: lysophospholipid acyltransferase family protein [Cupriavidus]|uniref:lysophospholipid acyltransferase family protein n=1 Tax=Cupriavidus TaxID=106589 RepID=UPI0002A22EBD|nr:MULTISPECIES: lysophospholipid acyltransferase family protein [Cupriavidus]EKZ95404.1 phospholipid/glycerol acyltransferase [Cupriavidus sp. HMR-1]QWC92290.1 1-acyl-sn-glycerol-3-phosphate acyltransferase [Cupriavidus metallidurans]